MRRYAFYFTVALLAFGVGIVFLHIYQAKESSSALTFMEESSEISVFNQKQIEFIAPERNEPQKKIQEREYLSDEEKAAILFGPTIKKWLGNQKVDKVVEPSSEVSQRIVESKLNVVDERILTEAAQKNYKPEQVDVNGDNKNELAIMSNCSESGICELWILKSSKESFEVILSSYQEVENFKLQMNKSKGHFNIETFKSYPKSQTFLGMKIYKFNGKEYYITDCFDYEFRYIDQSGKLQNLINPKFHPLHCC